MKPTKANKNNQREASLPKSKRSVCSDDELNALRQAIKDEEQAKRIEDEKYLKKSKASKIKLKKLNDELLRLQVLQQRKKVIALQEEEDKKLQEKQLKLVEKQNILKSGQKQDQVIKSQSEKKQEQQRKRKDCHEKQIHTQEGRSTQINRSENEPSREGSSSPEIIFEKREHKKRQADGPSKCTRLPMKDKLRTEQVEQDVRLPDKVFIPVTEESLSKVLGLIKRFEKEKRCVAIVFSSCFYLDNMNLEVIAEKFSPVFGHITAEQVLIRIDVPKLTKTPEEAYELGFKNLNQAYIIGDLNVTENDLNRKAAARQMFCCPMTLGCLANNLKQGLYLMHKSVVLDSKIGLSQCLVSGKEDLNHSDKSSPNDERQPSTGQKKKRDRIAATLAIDESKMNIESLHRSPSPASSSKETTPRRSKVDNRLWTRIITSGNVALKIENLPAKLTVHSLNLMMGTFSLNSHQIVATKRTLDSGLEVMDLMIVMHSENEDLTRILEKNKLKTALGIKLHIERSHLGKLRQFMEKNSDNLILLETSDKLPNKWIGYGDKSQ